MNLIIDDGNTKLKFAVFKNQQITSEGSVANIKELNVEKISNIYDIKNCIISSTRCNIKDFEAVYNTILNVVYLDNNTKLPIINKYKTPESLGKDRLAAVVAGYTTYKTDVMTIDAGTALTFDYINKSGEYLGGAISPGMSMRFKALHQFTAKLPLVKAANNTPSIGTTTKESIQSGVIEGMCNEIELRCIHFLEQHSNGKIILTGGDSIFFEKKLKSSIFVNPNLVLLGLNSILEYNAN